MSAMLICKFYQLFMPTELSILHERKRNRVAEFKEQQSLFVEFRDQKRAVVSKIRQQEKQAISQAKAEERFVFYTQNNSSVCNKVSKFQKRTLKQHRAVRGGAPIVCNVVEFPRQDGVTNPKHPFQLLFLLCKHA
jgi:hypothetical protein